MDDLTPRQPRGSLVWPSVVLDLHDILTGSEQPVYVVGGAVRDALLRRPVKDVDLAVAAGSIALGRKIADFLHGDFYILDKEREVARVLAETPEGRLTVDIARFRGESLLDDLLGRDFTLNAMAVDLSSDVSLLLDPLEGEADTVNHIIRRCTTMSIADDPIRALRAVRQSVAFRARIERATLADVRANAARLFDISPERVRDEFIKMLALENAMGALRVADAVGLLGEIVPETRALHLANAWDHTMATVEYLGKILASIDARRTDHTAATFGLGMLVMQLDRYRARLRAHIGMKWPDERPHIALLTLAAVLLRTEDATTAAERCAEALRLSNAEKLRLATLAGNHGRVAALDSLEPLDLYGFWNPLGAAGVDVCLLAAAEQLGAYRVEIDQDAWLTFVERLVTLLGAYFERYDEVVAPPALVDGTDLMRALGITGGPLVGELLEAIRQGQVTGAVTTVDEALDYARARLER